MASSTGSYLDMPFLQSGRHSSSLPYLGGGELPLAAQDSPPHHHAETYGDPQRQLTLRQAPMHARVAIGKEKGTRSLILQRPVVASEADVERLQTASRSIPLPSFSCWTSGTMAKAASTTVSLPRVRCFVRTPMLAWTRSLLRGKPAGPYLFMTSSLVSENYGESPDKDQELPSNYLVGSLVSSIHRLRDTDNVEGGFFVFGDLSVKREGRFRLRFTLYERDESSSSPSFYFVSELITNVFTVFSTKLFPGMADSTQLTRTFSNQGVKVRLRKDSSGMAARKRNRGVADVTDEFLDRQAKRSSYDRELPLNNYAVSDLGHMDPLHGVVSTAPPTSFLVAADAMSSSSSTPSRTAGLGMPLSASGYYFTGAHYY